MLMSEILGHRFDIWQTPSGRSGPQFLGWEL